MHINANVILDFANLDGSINFSFHFQNNLSKFESSLTKFKAIMKKNLLITCIC